MSITSNSKPLDGFYWEMNENIRVARDSLFSYMRHNYPIDGHWDDKKTQEFNGLMAIKDSLEDALIRTNEYLDYYPIYPIEGE